jgi:prefoldin subunit 5
MEILYEIIIITAVVCGITIPVCYYGINAMKDNELNELTAYYITALGEKNNTISNQVDNITERDTTISSLVSIVSYLNGSLVDIESQLESCKDTLELTENYVQTLTAEYSNTTQSLIFNNTVVKNQLDNMTLNNSELKNMLFRNATMNESLSLVNGTSISTNNSFMASYMLWENATKQKFNSSIIVLNLTNITHYEYVFSITTDNGTLYVDPIDKLLFNCSVNQTYHNKTITQVMKADTFNLISTIQLLEAEISSLSQAILSLEAELYECENP